MNELPHTTRRSAMKAAGVATLIVSATANATSPKPKGSSTLTFEEVPQCLDDTHHISDGHTAQVLLRWGDPLFPDAPQFDPLLQTAEKQKKQFGSNNDFIGFMPLPLGSRSSETGLLCVNHEYVHSVLSFPSQREQFDETRPKDLADIEMAAHGHSVVEVARAQGVWAVKRDSKYNRRFTPSDSLFELCGPVAGHRRVKTKDDPSGRIVLGTLGNCSGGISPWSTVVVGEENIQHYFGGNPRGTSEEANHLAMSLTTELNYNWYTYCPRFNLEIEPHEPNRFGWMVELDPYDPASNPKKRTALGRFKHEGAGFALTPDGRVVVYMGDDEVFQHMYRFISARAWNMSDREKNRDLLDEGTLYVARFEDNQKLTWLPLIWGQGPLTPANGFQDQGDVLIETRRAAKLLGATPLDRPEEVVPNPITGTVFAALTKNSKRVSTDGPNPRAENRFGGLLELLPPGYESKVPDHAASVFGWRPFILAGPPQSPDSGVLYHADLSADGWFANPDNIEFDPQGRIWIATDGFTDFSVADGLWVSDVTGPGKALSRRFFACPRGAEMTGPCFTPDGTSLFCSIQHPGEGSSFRFPSTRWPDFQDGLPPRSSVVVLQRKDGKPLG